ncbi:AMP-binding protein [Desulfonatronovibrio magnus]|uniref:AMP-binding protein n=1 Tax=Desulfonatronovibrio magnus TaxID=698827 RepID=UPI000A01DB47|nr:AMP-binding protein [Desulfonatronovibrio magnus]
MQLHHRFIQTAKKFPKKIAVHDIAAERELTYERMLIVSLILSKRFKKIKTQYVGVMVPTSAGCMLTNLGLLMAGKIPVMINYATGALENSLYAQDKCSFKTILTSKKLLDKLDLKPVEGMEFLEDIVASVSLTEKIPALVKAKMPENMVHKMVHSGDDDETAVILFTSGSEKEPKSVQLTHKNIGHNLDSIPKVVDVDHKDVFLASLPLFHVFGLTANFWMPLTTGTSIVTYPNPLEFKVVCSLVRDYKVTIMTGTPSFYHGYLKKSQPGDFTSVRVALSGADTLAPQIYDGFQEKQGITLLDAYGATETSPAISINTPSQNKKGSVGKPLPGVEVRILNVDTDDELPPGETGKILVKGDMVMKGYLGDLEETTMRIHNGWYDTGDMGLLDEDGFLWHKGRLKRFVKVGGEMVSLVRVEEVLYKYVADEVLCCVVGIPNPTKGSDIVAAITTDDFSKRKLIKQMSKDLPAIAVPKEFYVIKDIPVMGSGKVNFREVERICRKMSIEGK